MKKKLLIISMIKPDNPIEFNADEKTVKMYLDLSKNQALKRNKKDSEVVVYGEKIYNSKRKIEKVILRQDIILKTELENKTSEKEILFV